MVITNLQKHLYIKELLLLSFLSAITTPAACVATFRFNPSNFNERSVNFFTLGSSLTSF